jgi:prolyl oligopeptidase
MKKIGIFFFAIIFFSSTVAQVGYPPSKTVDSNNIYFGVTYRDPYRWLEYMKQPATAAWFKQQAAYADSMLSNLNGRNELITEWEAVDKQFPSLNSDRVYENGRIFYRKTTSAASVGKIYYREGLNGKEELLFDPTTYIPGKTISVQEFSPSHDGRKLAIEYAENGSEISTIKIIDVDSRKFLKDSLYPAYFTSWTFDDRSFLYQWLQSADIKDPSWRFNSKTKLHVLGTDSIKDLDFFSGARYPELNIDPDTYPYAYLEEGARNYIFAGVDETRYYAPIAQIQSKKIPWKVLYTISDSLVELEYVNDYIYAISQKNAPNDKIVVTSMEHPDWAAAAEILAEKPGRTIKQFTASRDYLLIIYSDGINNYLSKYNLKTKAASDVALPFSGTIKISCINTQTNACILRVNSWIKPLSEYNYDAATDRLSPSSLNSPFVFPRAYSDLQAEEVEVKGKDGVMIPLSIIHKKGINLAGSSICLLTGYGAYGTSMFSYFDWLKNSLAARGVVIAFAHVRGGGEKGERWHKAAFKSTKPNTWNDFISCAEYLIAKKYTSPQKLAGFGESAGGILISRAITQRPDLFAAAICNVGAANAMRLEFTGNTGSVREFGTIKDSVECRALYEMDGLQHVVKGTKYPAVICLAGWNDPRVPAWQPGKFAAALQNASTSGRPVLMKVNYNSGHSTEDRYANYVNAANMLAFVLWQCGHPDFQPKNQ